MDKKIVILIVIFFLLLVYGSVKFQKLNPDVDYFSIYLQIADYDSVEANETSVLFTSQPGKIISGSTMIRNDGNKINKVEIFTEGELVKKGWLSISEFDFEIKPGEIKNIGIEIKIPENVEGNYDSKLRIESG